MHVVHYETPVNQMGLAVACRQPVHMRMTAQPRIGLEQGYITVSARRYAAVSPATPLPTSSTRQAPVSSLMLSISSTYYF